LVGATVRVERTLTVTVVVVFFFLDFFMTMLQVGTEAANRGLVKGGGGRGRAGVD
jgi:hypothetical protein